MTTTTGPATGAIIGHGGGNIDKDKIFKEQFLRLAGGGTGQLVYIPTAFSDEQLSGRGAKQLDSGYAAARFGFDSAAVLHTRDRAVADSEQFCRPLITAAAVFFTGGRQWRLMDAYLGTRFVSELRSFLDRGGVIGGSSAGITALGSLLVRGNSAPDDNTIMLGDHRQGFGFIENAAIDQHLLEQNRQLDMLQVLQEYPRVLGIGIDVQTSIIVEHEILSVYGASQVAIYDGLGGGAESCLFLTDGDGYNLRHRCRL